MAKLPLMLVLLAWTNTVSLAQYPVIEAEQGFEVDMEPFWIETDFDSTNPTPLDVQGYFREEMQVVLPNLMGVILQKYDDTVWDSTTASRAFYTGMAVFQGPPFRTNHQVYQAETAALTSLRAAKSYLRVHDAALGIPDWFNATSLGDQPKVKMTEETDSTLDPNLLFGGNDNLFSMEGVAVGACMGFVLGAVLTFVVMLCRRRRSRQQSNLEPRAPSTPPRQGTPRHKRKASDNDLSLHEEPLGGSNSDIENEPPEVFCDEEEAQEPLTKSPPKKEGEKEALTPRKRRPSHHRRWKSSAFHDMQSPSSVMDGIFLPSTPKSASTNRHRRSNSLADAFGGSGHRRSSSMADAFKQGRRESMVELLAADVAELMNSENILDD